MLGQNVRHTSASRAPCTSATGSTGRHRRRRLWLGLVTGVCFAALLLLWQAARLGLLTTDRSVSVVADHVAVAMARPAGSMDASELAVALAETHARDVRMLPTEDARGRRLRCIGWRATDNCSPHGPRIPRLDKACSATVPTDQPGYCEVQDRDSGERFRVMRRYCRSLRPDAEFRCVDAPAFARFPLQAADAIQPALAPGFTLPNVHRATKSTDGIVMAVYPKLVASAVATIRALRELQGCTLPLELWYLPHELQAAPHALRPLEQLVQAANASDRTPSIQLRAIEDASAKGFNAKIHALYHSHFDRVLFLDADNVPVRDPSYLFELQEFQDTGAIFWPDFWHPRSTIFNLHGQSLLWELLNQPFPNMFEQESGQLVIDRRRHAAPLELVRFYAFHQPNLLSKMKLLHGDKDLFRLAWLKLKAPFHMIQTPPAIAGKLENGSFCGITMVQHDPDGRVLFLHRNSRKLTGLPRRQEPQKQHAEVAAILSAREKLLRARPGGRTTPTWQEVSEELALNPLAPTLEPLAADGLPDVAFWTHLVSFDNSSASRYYVVEARTALPPEVAGSQTCYGPQRLNETRHFTSQPVAELSFAGLETHLRRFAMEAAQDLEPVIDQH